MYGALTWRLVRGWQSGETSCLCSFQPHLLTPGMLSHLSLTGHDSPLFRMVCLSEKLLEPFTIRLNSYHQADASDCPLLCLFAELWLPEPTAKPKCVPLSFKGSPCMSPLWKQITPICNGLLLRQSSPLSVLQRQRSKVPF